MAAPIRMTAWVSSLSEIKSSPTIELGAERLALWTQPSHTHGAA